jgi:fibronectin type 3 domain-containing protein
VLTEPAFTDKIQFGTEKCYVVRNVTMVGAVVLESEPSARVCVTARDTFAPAAPKELAAVSDDQGISLIWEANTEPDLGGYLVTRQQAGGEFVSLTPEAIRDTSYRDTTADVGRSYAYQVVAVDTATPANRSEPSNRVEVVR